MGSLKQKAAGKKPTGNRVPARAKAREAPKVLLNTPKPADLTLDPAYLQLFDKLALDLAHENRDTFDSLSLHEQKAVLDYLSDALVDGDFSNQVHDLLWEMDFKKKPAAIGDFLSDEYFMGRSCSDLHPAWREDLEYVFAPGSSIFEWVLTGAIGIGKGLTVDEPVLTPGGWVRNGDLNVGAQVIGSDGRATEVTGVFPRGVLPVYRVTFDDGTSVKVDGDHLWAVTTSSGKHRGSPWRTLSTEELVEAGVKNASGQRKWHIPVLSAPVEFAPVDLPLSAYALGALLGGGSLTTGIKISSADLDLVEDVAFELGLVATPIDGTDYDYSLSYSPRGGRTPNQVLNAIRELGLDVRSEHKHIPEVYFRASVSDRIELLRGLMDTDGWVQNGGKSSLFCSTSHALADGVVRLVQSLGGIARVAPKPTDSLLAYNVDINLTVNPFSLPRKASKWRPAEKYKPRRMIDSIEPAGMAEVVCIQVAAQDQLYVANHCVVTHNTTIACAALAYKIYYLSCLLSPASYYGLLPDSLIVFGIYSITKRQVADAGYFKLRGYLDSSPYFRREFPRSKKIDSKVVFTKGNVQVIPGSQELHALGLDLFSYLMDEVNFMRAKADKESGQATGQAYDLYNSTYSRLLSRFMRPGGTVPGLMLLLSSRNSQTSFLEGHLQKVGKSHSTHISDYPLWEVKPKHRFTKKPFKVEVGDRVSRSRLLKETEEPRPGAKVIEVPGDLRKPFEEDVDQALRDIAGVATFNLSPLIRDRQSVFDAYREHMVHPFTRETLVIDCDPDGDRLDSCFKTKDVCRVQNSKWVPRLNPTAPRFVHCDIGLTNDCYGLAMGHVAGLIANERVGPDGMTSVVENPYIVIDLMLQVRAAIGEEVDLSKLRGFIIFLSRLFPLCKVTFDQFQSADSIQILRKAGLDVGKNSVDATDAAYLSLRSAHFERRIAMYEYEPYETEILDLERNVKARKVDHPLKSSKGGRGSKDVSDAVAGVVDLCINDPRARADAVQIEDFDLLLKAQTNARRGASDVPADKAATRRIAGRHVGWDSLRDNLHG